MNSRFQIARAPALHMFAADDQVALYDTERESTHLLDEVAAAVFAALQRQGLTEAELLLGLAATYPDDPTDQQAAAVKTALAALMAHGLVELAP